MVDIKEETTEKENDEESEFKEEEFLSGIAEI